MSLNDCENVLNRKLFLFDGNVFAWRSVPQGWEMKGKVATFHYPSSYTEVTACATRGSTLMYLYCASEGEGCICWRDGDSYSCVFVYNYVLSKPEMLLEDEVMDIIKKAQQLKPGICTKEDYLHLYTCHGKL